MDGLGLQFRIFQGSAKEPIRGEATTKGADAVQGKVALPVIDLVSGQKLSSRIKGLGGEDILNFDKKTINVDTEKFETNQKGIYAVGDICNYPGKLKLILSGFHEGALAARACFKLARTNEKYRFEITTSSKTIKNRLGVKGD